MPPQALRGHGSRAPASARHADRRQIGFGQVLLAEMNEIAPLLDSEAPIIVDDELAAVARAGLLGPANFGAKNRVVLALVFDPELDQSHAERDKPVDPRYGVYYEVERIEPHEKTALPMTGVDGTAMSRGSSMPARWAVARLHRLGEGGSHGDRVSRLGHRRVQEYGIETNFHHG